MIRSKGLFAKKLVTASQLVGRDYLIAKHGDSFHANVQTAFDAGVPCLLFYENDPEKLIDCGLNEKNWPDDKNADLQAIIKDVMVGGVQGTRRAIHGIMIDCSKVVQSNGKILTAQWIAQSGNHLMNRVWSLLKIPVYLYMNMNPINQYKDDAVSTETLRQFIGRWGGVSTVDWAQVGADGYPVADERPLLPYDDGQPWKFWFYHVDSNPSTGSGTNIDVLYQWDKVRLYGKDELGYQAPATPDPSTGSTSSPTGSGTGSPNGSGAGGSTGSPTEGVIVLKLGAEELALLERAVTALEEMAKPMI
jgi:hypothetical protein